MESLPNCLLKYNPDTLTEVRKAVHLDSPGAMEQAVEILDTWVQKQSHFVVKKFDRHYLEYTIVMSKGSIERAKTKLDRSCTSKTMMPHLFVGFDFRKDFQEDLKTAVSSFMPRLTKEHNRVYIHRNTAKEFEPTVIATLTKRIAMFAEFIRRYEYCISNILIVDYREINLTELMKIINVNDMRQLAALLLECHGFRVAAIHVLTNSRIVDMLINAVKLVVSPKIGDRFHTHKDLESLHKVVEKDILPEEYGGKEKSLFELSEQWIDALMSEEYQEYQKHIFSTRTDENMRQTDKFNEAYLGMPGTFRTLKVD